MSAASLVGRWAGTIALPDGDLVVVADFSDLGDGLEGILSIPAQGIPVLRLTSVKLDPSEIFPRPVTFSAAQVEATFQGQWAADIISGTFTQAGISTPFQLERLRTAEPAAPPTK